MRVHVCGSVSFLYNYVVVHMSKDTRYVDTCRWPEGLTDTHTRTDTHRHTHNNNNCDIILS